MLIIENHDHSPQLVSSPLDTNIELLTKLKLGVIIDGK